LGGWLLGLLGTSFPYGTLAVNLIGSFLVGAIMHLSLASDLVGPTLRLALTTGFLGGVPTLFTLNLQHGPCPARRRGLPRFAQFRSHEPGVSPRRLPGRRSRPGVGPVTRKGSVHENSRWGTGPRPDLRRRVGQVASSAADHGAPRTPSPRRLRRGD